MIDLLVFVKALIQVTFATTGAPKNIPLMALGWSEVGVFQNRSNQFIVKSEHFKE